MRRAFILGSNGPDNFAPLKFARKDTERLKATLSSPRCNFDVITPKTGDNSWAVRQQLTSITETCLPEDTLICYFSGHGILEKGSLFLFWDNTTPDRLLTTALPVTEIMEALKYCKANSKLLILDCCHAGAVVNMLGLKDAVGLRVEEMLINPDNHLVLMASGRLERARELESLEGSFLTFNICSALGENFFEADKDKDNRISIQDLKQWLERKAQEHNREFPDSSVPYPYLFGQQKGNFFLTIDTVDWIPHEFPLVDGITMVVLPVRLPYNHSALCMSKHPITNAQYKKFVKEVGKSEPIGKRFFEGQYQTSFYPWHEDGFRESDKPVVCVSYRDASSYCIWLNEKLITKKSKQFHSYANQIMLPTTREWDFAAFGTMFPIHDPRIWLNQTRQLHHNSLTPASIDFTGVRTNARGISDMFGNVWEWCSEMHIHPTIAGRNIEQFAQLRGGSFLDDLSKTEPFYDAVRPELRAEHGCYSDLGFRIAMKIGIWHLPKDIQLQLSLCGELPLGFEDLKEELRFNSI